MTFELLPNEIFVECCEYLNGPDIFYSFDRLNHRFNQLIRNIRLYVDFGNVSPSMFDLFCKKMVCSPEIKENIYSLSLSNKDIYPQIESFSIDEFTDLQSLTLVKIKENNIEQVKSILPSLSQLLCFRIIDSEEKSVEIISTLSISGLRILTILTLPKNPIFLYEIPSITRLTIFRCISYELCLILENISGLEYLNIEHTSSNAYWPTDKDLNSTDKLAIHLKQLIMMELQFNFSMLLMIFQRTPNLKSLTVSATNERHLIDAYRWEHLMTSSLLYLNIFKFKFEYRRVYEDNLLEKFNKFESDFWQQHHWYSEFLLSNEIGSIYTIPYRSNTYELFSNTKRYSNKLMDDSNIFKNVLNLTVNCHTLTGKREFYFNNVTSLSLPQRWVTNKYNFLEIDHVEFLKTIVNLPHLKHLDISKCSNIKTSSALLELLKQALQLSSISIDQDDILQLFVDDNLCKYFNKMITKLEIMPGYYRALDECDDLKHVCKVFSNIEQLTCRLDNRDSLLFLLKHLPKLLRLNFYGMMCSKQSTIRKTLIWLKEEATKLGIKIVTDYNYFLIYVLIIKDI